MAKTTNQKKKLAVLMNIFAERTDASHPMSIKELIAALEAFDIKAERKTVYSDIEALKELGNDIQMIRGKTTGYYLTKREFELPELKLLADAVRASKFITEKKSEQLIKKLSRLANCHDRASLNREIFVSNKAKSENEDIYLTVDRIHEAMESDRKISFGYFSWTHEKKKELRRNGARYTVSPFALVWDDSNYYLVGFDDGKSEIRHFRVDKMLKTALCQEKRRGKEEFESFDIRSYSGAVFGMFGGEKQRVTLSCANRLANVIIDRFGQDTVILKESDSRFRVHVNVVASPMFLGWVLSFQGEISIVSPENVLRAAEEIIKNAAKGLKCE